MNSALFLMNYQVRIKMKQRKEGEVTEELHDFVALQILTIRPISFFIFIYFCYSDLTLGLKQETE